MELAYALNKDSEWTGITTPFRKDALIFDLYISDIRTIYSPNDFFTYIRETIHAMITARGIHRDNYRENEYAFANYIKDCCEKGTKSVVFVIRSPENFERSDIRSAKSMRNTFWCSLADLLNKHSNISVICSTTPAVMSELELLKSEWPSNTAFRNMQVFSICPLNEEDVRLYIEKWLALHYPAGGRDAMADELWHAIKNNSLLRSFIMSSPQAVTMFLAAAKIDSRDKKFTSQAHMLKIINRAAITHVLTAIGVDEYDFIIPLSRLALRCSERATTGFGESDIDNLFDKDSAAYRNMGEFLTERANEEDFRSAISVYPFIRKASSGYIFTTVWRNYYAAKAIAYGILDRPESNYIQRISGYVDRKMTDLLDKSKIDDNEAAVWVSVIAMAAKLSRQNASEIVTVLEKYAEDFSPKNRRGRELSVCMMLKILRNRSFLSPGARRKIVGNSLKFFLYHQQIEDIDAIVSSSPYRRSIVTEMFDEFSRSISIDPPEPIPLFHFVIGYLVSNFVKLADWDGTAVSACDAILSASLNDHRYFAENAAIMTEIFTEKYDGWCAEGKIIYALALNGITWLSLSNSVRIGQFQPPVDGYDLPHEYFVKYGNLLTGLISSEHYQISNIALYALSHIMAAERSTNLRSTFIQELTNPEMLRRMLLSDYAARTAYDRKFFCSASSDIQPYCGALRSLIMLEPDAKQIIACTDSQRNSNDNIDSYYRDVWNKHLSEYQSEEAGEDAERMRNNARRYLVLMFRPCILSGAFGALKEQLSIIDFIWGLKYSESPKDCLLPPKTDIKICLEYDQEDRFYSYLLRLRGQINAIQFDADTESQRDHDT